MSENRRCPECGETPSCCSCYNNFPSPTDLQSLAERVFECNLAQDYATSRKLAKDVPSEHWAEFDALVAQLAREYRQALTQAR